MPPRVANLIGNYLSVLEATSVAVTLRPFSSRRSNKIIASPKVYGFDTGFVCAPTRLGFYGASTKPVLQLRA